MKHAGREPDTLSFSFVQEAPLISEAETSMGRVYVIEVYFQTNGGTLWACGEQTQLSTHTHTHTHTPKKST
jgi:hypothetical protein